jgi:hypothetical protein
MKNKREEIEYIDVGDTEWELGDMLESYKPEVMAKILDKMVQIIDRLNQLNGQSEETTQIRDDDIKYLEGQRKKELEEGIAWIKQRERKVSNGKVKPEKQKRWEKRLHYLLIGYSSSKTYKESKEQWMEIRDYIEQLLSEREREVVMEIRGKYWEEDEEDFDTYIEERISKLSKEEE